MGYEPKPIHAYAEIVPVASSVDLQSIVASMKRNGYSPDQPIVLLDGSIIDGRTRQMAAIEAGVTPTFEDWESRDRGGVSPVEWVLNANVNRRHLTAAQKALAASTALPFEAALAAERQRAGVKAEVVPEAAQGRAVEIVAKAAGVGKTMVQQVKAIADAAAAGNIHANLLQVEMAGGTLKAGTATKIFEALPVLTDKAPQLIPLVIDGTMKLSDALKDAGASVATNVLAKPAKNGKPKVKPYTGPEDDGSTITVGSPSLSLSSALSNIEDIPADFGIALASFRERGITHNFSPERLAAAAQKLTDLVAYINDNGGVHPSTSEDSK